LRGEEALITTCALLSRLRLPDVADFRTVYVYGRMCKALAMDSHAEAREHQWRVVNKRVTKRDISMYHNYARAKTLCKPS
jgi:hypothetical protein